LNPACLSLVDLHCDVAFVLRKMAEDKGLRFSGTVEQGLVEAVSDCLKLREIALNLGTNAVKYTRFGSVSLRFARRGAECWMLEVDDTGPGIPIQSRQKIFQDFQRLPETSTGQPGAGLGLAIVRRLVQLLKRRIELESEAGSGTSFRVIPCQCTTRAAGAAVRNANSPPPDLDKKHAQARKWQLKIPGDAHESSR
jgi:signal transduction histidine kinase